MKDFKVTVRYLGFQAMSDRDWKPFIFGYTEPDTKSLLEHSGEPRLVRKLVLHGTSW